MSRPDKPNPLGKPTAIDYVVLFGGPIAFLAIAVTLILYLIGPAPRQNPVERIKAGAVRVGMTVEDVERAVGPPREATDREDGGFTYRYKSSPEPFVEEDAFIDFSPAGRVLTINIERQSVRPPGDG